MKPKIVIIFAFATFLSINVCCSHKLEDRHIIPDVPVYTQIDLSIGGESDNWIDKPQYYQSSSTGKALGYNGHGIIIYTNNNTTFKCFDATCTNCSDLNSFMTQRDLDGSFARCPVCGTKFLLIYGYPEETEEKIYPLKEYPIVKSGNKLIVSYK